jgi:HAD superfamily hydrolase (TIGR01509 family)
MFTDRGLDYRPEWDEDLRGRSIDDVAARLATVIAEPAALLHREYVARAIAAVRSQAHSLPGATKLVAALSSRVPVGVASNAPRAWLAASLAAVGLTSLLPTSIAGDEVTSPKPAPEIYLAVCARLGVSPHSALAIEDSPTGVAAAKAAGLITLAVTRTPIAADADMTLSSLQSSQLLQWVTALPHPPVGTAS